MITAEHKLAVIIDNGVFRVHRADCADVPREAKKYRDEPWLITAPTRHEVNLSCWGDVASDNTDVDTPEWHALCDEYASAETRYLPCCPATLK